MSFPQFDDVDAWDHLQYWFNELEDPMRPWNIAAIARTVGMAQPTVRALLRAPKDEPGYNRAGFTREKLKIFQKLFKTRDYDPRKDYKSEAKKAGKKASRSTEAQAAAVTPDQPVAG